MEQIIKKIQIFFGGLNTLEIELNFKTKKIKSPNFNEIDFLLYSQRQEIKSDLQQLYLKGIDLTLNRVKTELFKIKNMLLQLDYGLTVTLNNDIESKIIIETEIIKKMAKINLKHVDNLIVYIDQLTPQQQKKEKKRDQAIPKKFEDLFKDTNFVSPCIDILKKVEPPLIDKNCNYIGKSKGAFCVWINEMERQEFINHYSDRKIFAEMIPLRIKNFSIDESMFGKHQSKAEKIYRTDIKTLLSQIKLS